MMALYGAALLMTAATGCDQWPVEIIVNTNPDTSGTTVDTPTPGQTLPEIVATAQPRCDLPERFAKTSLLAMESATSPEGRYIVVLEDGVSAEMVGQATAFAKGSTMRIFKNAINGFAGRMDAEEVEKLRRDPRVRYIEPDYMVSLGSQEQTVVAADAETEPWGVTGVGGSRDGSGKVAWIIDTGIDLYNTDLNVDRTRSRNFVPDGRTDATDHNGHGTHVAGIIGAKKNGLGVVGVAAGAKLVGVRVLNDTGAGYYSSIISGVDYAAANAKAGDVINMSLGGEASRAIDEAVRRAADRGLKVVIAAGNERQSTANISPARLNYAGVYTVSAINSRGSIASFSNYGAAVDAAAPGVDIISTRLGGGLVRMSGTSMAAPHVTGLLLFGKVHANGYATFDPDGCADPLAYR